ncbi:MAG: antibiotic biosynthesis monooxygenase, partial [Bacteroidales bacterium]|nr:antibiotic biosynthesis monooxygenase [Bacteroidales bacterium]
MAIPSHAQITINIRYSGKNGGAQGYVKEMEESGIAARIRAVEGCLRYDYFFPADDPEGLLLIDEWADQEALNRYHSSPMMKEAAALREKYGLGDRRVTLFNPVGGPSWPKGEPNDAYAQYFIGQSYLYPLPGGYANVTFEPGCRNNWHIHHGAVQVLICVSGRGWYQEWGKPAVPLTPGTIIEIPEGVKHWHGAAADSWMQ